MKLLGIQVHPRQAYYVAGDTIAAVLAIYLAHSIRLGRNIDASEVERIPLASVVFLVASWVVLYTADAYNPTLNFRRPLEIMRLCLAVVPVFFLQVLLYFLLPDVWWGRGIAGLTSFGFGALLVLWRVSASVFNPGPVFSARTLIVGDGEAGTLIAQTIQASPDYRRRYELVGALLYPRFGFRRSDDDPTTAPPIDVPEHIPVLGGVRELGWAVHKHKVQHIIVAIRGGVSPNLARGLLDAKAKGVMIEEMPTAYKRMTSKVPILHLSDDWLLFGPVFSGSSGVANALQRAMDVFLALIGLALSAPVVLLAGIAVKLESPGGAFFLQERLGRNEVPFNIIKLRTMRSDAEAKSGAVWSQGAGDPRVTRVGRLLRRSRIDELPQFWNVLVGDMSIVGPRPEREFFVKQLKESIPFYGLRFSVKPGVTGWAQVNYRYGASTEDAVEKLCYELYSIQELTPALYALIVLKTVQTMLLRPGS